MNYLIMNEVKKEIEEEYGVRHTTLQVEPEDYKEIDTVDRNEN